MAASATDAAAVAAARERALDDLHFTSITNDVDLTPSEDEAGEEQELQLETVQSAIGISIGEQQTRLTSPKTPAAEKAAALDEVDGGGLFDGWQQSTSQELDQGTRPPARPPPQHTEDAETQAQTQTQTPTSTPATDTPRLPSPWRAEPKTFKQSESSGLPAPSRRRALSGGSTSEALKKYMPFNLPSLSKTGGLFNLSMPSFAVSSFDNMRGRLPSDADRRKRVMSMYSPSPSPASPRPIPQRHGSGQTPIAHRKSLPRPASPRRSRSQPRPSATAPLPQHPFGSDGQSTRDSLRPELHSRPTSRLRRSNSEHSFLLYRNRSFASSLGDDSRFENVQEQVNSRLKALKDSWQDANFKLPSMPSLPNFSFTSREDLFRSRNNSSASRAVNADPAPNASNYRASLLAAPSTSSRRERASNADLPGTNATTHPYFTQALQDLEGDLVVLGGYRGSILRSAGPPNRQLWVPLKVGLNLRKVDLEIGLDPEDEETMEERIIPGGMLTHIGPVDIAKRLFKRLRASENAKKGTLRVHDYGYDWRLSPHILSRRLIKYLESLPCNQPSTPPSKRGAYIIAHSLGGLITRHAINQRPDLVAGVVYAGVPQTCVNILGPLRNGDDVMFSSRVLTAQVNFTIRTSYALLPLDGKCFINKYTKEEYPVDFFDINTWKEHRLSPCIAPPLPPANQNGNQNLSVSGLLNAMSQALPSLPGRKSSLSSKNSPTLQQNGFPSSGHSTNSTSPASNTSDSHGSPVRDAARNAADKVTETSAQTTGMDIQMTNSRHPHQNEYTTANTTNPNPATTVTIPQDRAVEYLTRTLAETKQFKQELSHRPEHTRSNAYPPIALIYGKSTPTVYGAKVESREAIKRTDVYDELAFASGDGVVLAKAAMVPQGYSVVRGGVVSSDRGHVTLLGDLEAVGRCLQAVVGARRNGVGLGEERKKSRGGSGRDEVVGATGQVKAE